MYGMTNSGKLFSDELTEWLMINHQLDFIGAFLQANVKNRVFVKLDMRYAAYFPEYTQYFVRALKLLKSMYGMTNSGKLFTDELTGWLIK